MTHPFNIPLDRAMEFTLNVLQRISDKPDLPLSQAVTESYTETLLKFHGFVASSAFYVGFDLSDVLFITRHSSFLC